MPGASKGAGSDADEEAACPQEAGAAPSTPLRAAFPPARVGAAPARSDRAWPRRPRAVLRLSRLLRLGRRARRVGGRRRPALAARSGALPGARSARGRRRDPDAAARPARGPAVSQRRDLSLHRRHARSLGGHARRRPGRHAAGVVERRVGQDPRRDDGGDARLGRDDARRHRRRAHPLRLPVRRGRAAADGRLGRGRAQGDLGLRDDDHARAAHGRGLQEAADGGPRDARALHACACRAPGRLRRDARVRGARQAQARAEEEAGQGRRGRELLVGRGTLPGSLRRRRRSP